MNVGMFLSMFMVLGILYFILGVYSARRVKSISDYFLAGRDLGIWALTFTLVATQVGGGMLLGSADAAYRDGYFGIFYSLGMGIGFLILGLGFGAKLRQFEVSTTSELFEVVYGSKFLRKVTSVISALSMMGIFAAQIVASRALFYGLGITNEYFLILFWVLVILYTMIGGLRAIVINDIFQSIIFLSVLFGIFIYALMNSGSGPVVPTQFANFKTSFWAQIPALVTSAIYPLFGQDMAQRFFAARSRRIATVSALISGAIVIALAFVPVYFGMKAKMLGMVIPQGTSVLCSVLGVFTNDFVFALFGCAVIAAIASTADALLCAISSNVILDFECWSTEGCQITATRKKLFLSKTVTLVSGVAGMAIAYYATDILKVLSESYGLLISCLFVPVIFCFFIRKKLPIAAGASVFAGAIAFAGLRIFVPTVSEIVLVFFPLLISFMAYLVGYFFDRCGEKS
jgi:solute:Na+ symporter, SSS family